MQWGLFFYPGKEIAQFIRIYYLSLFRGGTMRKIYLWLKNDIEHTSTIFLALDVILFLVVCIYAIYAYIAGLIYCDFTIFLLQAILFAVSYVFVCFFGGELIHRARKACSRK